MSAATRAFLLLLVAATVALWRGAVGMPATLVVVGSPTGSPQMFDSGRIIDLPQEVPAAHASSIVGLRDGGVLVAWFAGTREGAADVTIEMARVKPEGDAERWTALRRTQLESLSHRAIRKLGNPVIWLDASGQLHLFVVSVSLGGWSGSAVNHLTSHNLGRDWSWGSRLILSPLLNLSTLVRTPPLQLAEGSIGLPCYHEFLHKRSRWVQLSADGRVLDSVPIYRAGDSLQPAVAALDEQRALAVMRAPSGGPRQVLAASTGNAGGSWHSLTPLDIPNPDSSVALLRLDDGALLMAANPLQSGRGVLQLFLSANGGGSWQAGRVVESGAGEYSYPALALGPGGVFHLSYTLDRTHIRLRTFDREWAEASAP